MTILTEGLYSGHFIVSEANGSRSRSVATLEAGQDLKAGAVVQDNAGKLVVFAAGGTASGVLLDNTNAVADSSVVILDTACELNDQEIQWDAGLSPADVTAGEASLKLLGIKLLKGVI